MRYYDSFLKGPASPSGRAKWFAGAKLQYSATITTPTDILFPTTSTLEVLSAPRPEEREESALARAGRRRPGGRDIGVEKRKKMET